MYSAMSSKRKTAPQVSSPAQAESKEALREEMRRMKLSQEGPVNPHTPDSFSTFLSKDLENTFCRDSFKKGVKISLKKFENEKSEFELLHVDPPIANAIRRVMIAEVESVAIETVHLYQNTGIMHDEILCHRLGLIPIHVPNFERMEPPPVAISDPTLSSNDRGGADFGGDALSAGATGEEPKAEYSLKFKLHVTCPRNHPPHLSLPVTSKDLQWEPMNDAQREMFKDDPPRPVFSDILITKLRQGQEVEAYCYAMRGCGRTHAKWSPVCSASYRLRPDIRIKKPVSGSQAVLLKNVCPMGVFDIEDSGQAKVTNERACTTCRACIDHPQLKDVVDLGKVKDNYMFTVESSGSLNSQEMVPRALEVLKSKCSDYLRELRNLEADSGHR